MKKIIITFIFCNLLFIAKSQDSSVEQSVYGIQTGFLGIWTHAEFKVSDKIALRGELGFDSEIFGSSFYEKTSFLMTPVLTLEPRWYYNLKKRVSKSKNIAGNSGNLVAMKTSYHPDWFVISNADGLRTVNQLSIIPTWGIRRTLGQHFAYETALGLGYRYVFAKKAGFSENKSETALNLHLRIGYKF